MYSYNKHSALAVKDMNNDNQRHCQTSTATITQLQQMKVYNKVNKKPLTVLLQEILPKLAPYISVKQPV